MRMYGLRSYEASPAVDRSQTGFAAGRVGRREKLRLDHRGAERHRGTPLHLSRRLRGACLRTAFFFGALATTRSYDWRMRFSSSLAGSTFEFARRTHL